LPTREQRTMQRADESFGDAGHRRSGRAPLRKPAVQSVCCRSAG
jgi:hypothetical protein